MGGVPHHAHPVSYTHLLESVGVKNVLAKSKGSSNPHNLVKATIGALCELRDAHSIARLRGISMDKVFNG